MRRIVDILIGATIYLVAGTAFAQMTLTDTKTMDLHDRLLTIDSHVDIGPGYSTPKLDPGVLNTSQVNLPAMRIGGLDAGFFIIFIPQGDLNREGFAKAAKTAEEKYAAIIRMVRANRGNIGLAISADEVAALHAQGKLIALIGIENSYGLGSTAEEVTRSVAQWAQRGVRYASITHFGHNQFGGSSNPNFSRDDAEDPGLTELGKVLIDTLNDHGIMVDISHVGPKTAADAIAASQAPVIASHSTVKAVYDNARGLTDEQLTAIRDTGGVAQITAFRSYVAKIDQRISAAESELGKRLGLTSFAAFTSASAETIAEYRLERDRIRREFDDVNLEQFLDHVDHAVRVAGIDHVGLSGDFDGGGGVEGWDGAAESPNVTAALLKRGYTEQDLAKLWGQNLLRVMREVEARAVQ